MREIKFRIWDGNKKEWLGTSNPDGMTWYGFHLVGECMTVQVPPYWKLDEQSVVEEYTGLKDSDGKEIYEGDIIEYNEEYKFRSKVIFKDGEFVLDNGITNIYFSVKSVEGVGEVIGNIHENPELLLVDSEENN